jgi:hypothetical protein
MEVMMFRKSTFAAAIIVGSVALSLPVLAANRGGDFYSGASDEFNQMQARGESQDTAGDQLAQRHPDGYDGDRYWQDGECFPTAPGGCD